MIRKHYKPDGAPDIRRWTVECDACHVRYPVLRTAQWLVTSHPHMPDYCPFCLAIIAAYLIERAFT